MVVVSDNPPLSRVSVPPLRVRSPARVRSPVEVKKLVLLKNWRFPAGASVRTELSVVPSVKSVAFELKVK